LIPGLCRRVDQGMKVASSFGNCDLKMLAEGFQTAIDRVEWSSNTKQSDILKKNAG
jgi:hypothetical protein